MNGIDLTKGGRINLEKSAPEVKQFVIGLGWKPNLTDTGADFDLDVTAFGLKIVNDTPLLAGRKDTADFMVFYGNHQSVDGAIIHSGDSQDGKDSNGGDDECISVDLTKLDPSIAEISFITTIHEAEERRQNFGQVGSPYIKIYDQAYYDFGTRTSSKPPLASYMLDEDFSTETAVQFGSLYKREDGAWAFKAIGSGYRLGLAAFVEGYGAKVAK